MQYSPESLGLQGLLHCSVHIMIKLTPNQAVRIRHMVRRLCANCGEDGNYLLLHDGEPQSCVQFISRYGLYCKYFKNAVLPADKKLLAEIKEQNKSH